MSSLRNRVTEAIEYLNAHQKSWVYSYSKPVRHLEDGAQAHARMRNSDGLTEYPNGQEILKLADRLKMKMETQNEDSKRSV